MYESFFGFREKPFALTPDPSFLFLGNKHGVGLTMLQYGMANRAGITVLTGEIGSGKTTLIRKLLDELGAEVQVGLISNTHASFGNLMQWVAVAYDLPARSGNKAQLYDRFAKFLVEQYAAGKRALLIVDEAQNLTATMLEELRLLTNINADKYQLLQLVLVGQPELRETLRRPDLEQFVQRIGVDYHLASLSGQETDDYIRHRLTIAGGDAETFEPVARRFIHHQCRGIPRLINALCDTALVYAFADSERRVSAQLVYTITLERIGAGLFGAGQAASPVAQSMPNEQTTGTQRYLDLARAEVAAEGHASA